MSGQVRRKPATYGKKKGSAALGSSEDFDLSSALKQLNLTPEKVKGNASF